VNLITGVIRHDDQPVSPGLVRQVLNSHVPDDFVAREPWIAGPSAMLRWTHGTSPRQHGQPMATTDGQLTITADARLDNRDDLLAGLNFPTDRRSTVSDDELILAAYRKWGAECPDSLEGDFSFAIYDRAKQMLTCVQSAFPQQPLYYVKTDRCFAFGSMIRPMLTLAGRNPQLNETAFAKFASRSLHVSDGERDQRYETMFAGVRCIPPATVMTVRNGSTSTRTWWRPDPIRELTLPGDQDYYDGVRDVTVRAVHDRLRGSHTPICHLSGGLDSSSIACIAARKLREKNRPLTAVSSVLPLNHTGPETDERHFIDIVAAAEDINVNYIHPAQTMTDDSSADLDWLEAPGSGPKGYVYRAFREAASRHGADVILDGCGGEIGPTNHAFGLFPWLARTGQWGTLCRELSGLSALTGDSFTRLLLRHVAAPHVSTIHRWYHRFRRPSRHVGSIALPLTRDFVARHNLEDIRPNADIGLPQFDPKQRLAFAIQRMQGGCRKHENAAGGIRTLYPFFDRRVIDYCLSVPARLNHVNGWKRNLIRQAMDGILPPEIQWRKCKAPFSPDFYRRFQQQLPTFRDTFESIPRNDIARDYYDVDAILKTLGDLQNRPGGETTPEGMRVKLCVQSSLDGIRFLQWFNRVSSEATSAKAA